MSVEHVEVIVEEQSIEAALRLLLPKLLGGMSFEVYPYQCKDELRQRLPERLRGYSRWLPDSWRIVVIVDRDNDECRALKAELDRAAGDAVLVTRTHAAGGPFSVVNRVAIEELEAWYFGDWEAVCAAYPRVLRTIPSKAKFRDPDAIPGGTWEALERILQKAGYFESGFRKIEAAQAIATHMEPTRNRSRSFCLFRDALREMRNP